jgi:hypothetical protein
MAVEHLSLRLLLLREEPAEVIAGRRSEVGLPLLGRRRRRAAVTGVAPAPQLHAVTQLLLLLLVQR